MDAPNVASRSPGFFMRRAPRILRSFEGERGGVEPLSVSGCFFGEPGGLSDGYDGQLGVGCIGVGG